MEPLLTQITHHLFRQSWHIALLIAAVAVVAYLARNRSAHVRYLLWLIVLAKCLVPPLYTVPLAVLPQRPVPEPAVATPAEAPPLSVELIEATRPQPYVSPPLPSAPLPVPEPVTPTGPAITDMLSEVSLRQWLAVIWIVGASLFALVALIKAWRTNRWLRRDRQPLPENLQAKVDRFFCDLGIKTRPKVWLITGVGQPFVWGVLRGSIYLPGKFEQVNGPAGWRGVLGHELSHVMRFDAAVNVLQVIAQAVYWFHPLVWWANKRVREEREKCCDEMAIARLNTRPKDYSTAIVNTLIAEHKAKQPVPSLAVAGPVKNIEDRIKTIMKSGKKFYRRPTFITIVTVLLLAAVAVPTTLALTSREKETAREKTATEAETNWGEAVDGLQFGLQCTSAKRSFRLGESVSFVFKLRNVGREKVELEYVKPHLKDWAPNVRSASGGVCPVLPPVRVLPSMSGAYGMGGGEVQRRTLKPGEEWTLDEVALTLRPIGWEGKIEQTTVFARSGKYKVSHRLVFPPSYGGRGEELWYGELASNETELEILPAGADAPGKTDASGEDIETVLRLLGDYVSQQLHAASGGSADGDAWQRNRSAWEARCSALSADEIEYLGHLANEHPEDGYRAAACEALGETKNARAVELLVEPLGDKVPYVRDRAARALGSLRSEKHIPELLRVLKSDTDSGVRASAAFTLGNIGSKRATKGLVEALESDKEGQVPEAVLFALMHVMDASALPALRAELKQETNSERRRVLENVIRRTEESGWGEAVEGLRCRWIGPKGPVVVGERPEFSMEVENVSAKPIFWECRDGFTWHIIEPGSPGTTRAARFQVSLGRGAREATPDEIQEHFATGLSGYYCLERKACMTISTTYPWPLSKAGPARIEGYLMRKNPHASDYPYPEGLILCPPLVLDVVESAADTHRWGEVVDGVRVRLDVKKRVLKVGESLSLMPKVHSDGSRILVLHHDMGLPPTELEVDGQWYQWDPRYLTEERPSPGLFRSGSYESDFLVCDYMWADKKTNEHLKLVPGKHRMRIALVLEPRDSGSKVRAVSNPVEIEILPAESDIGDTANTSSRMMREVPNAIPILRLEKPEYVLGETIRFWVGVECLGDDVVISEEFWDTCFLYVTRPDGTARKEKVGWPVDGQLYHSWTGGCGLGKERVQAGTYTLVFEFAKKQTEPVELIVQELDVIKKVKASFNFQRSGNITKNERVPIILTVQNDSEHVIRFPRRGVSDAYVSISVKRREPPRGSDFFYPVEKLRGALKNRYNWGRAASVPPIVLQAGELFEQELLLEDAYQFWGNGHYEVAFSTTLALTVGEKDAKFAAYCPIRLDVTATENFNVVDRRSSGAQPGSDFSVVGAVKEGTARLRAATGIKRAKGKTSEQSKKIEFLGLDLTDAPRTTDWAQLPDLFEERPAGSKSYEIRTDVAVVFSSLAGTVYYLPAEKIYYVQHDDVGSSVLHYYGPFEGDPHEVLDLEKEPEVHGLARWGEAVDGVQCRLRADKTLWQMNDLVTFALDLRNVGNEPLDLIQSKVDACCEVEYDGHWYEWAEPTVTAGTALQVAAGDQVLDAVEIKLIPYSWVGPRNGRPFRRPQRQRWVELVPDSSPDSCDVSVHDRSESWEEYLEISPWRHLGGKYLEVGPGRHVVRVRFYPRGTWQANEQAGIISNPVEIEILPAEPRRHGVLYGEAVDGVQCRVRARKGKWQAGKKVTLEVDIRNQGSRQMYVSRHSGEFEVEFDGRWYCRGALDVSPYIMRLGPGQEYNDIMLSLDQGWATKEGGEALYPAEGKHKVRVALTAQASEKDEGEAVRAVSNVVEMEILPAGQIVREDKSVSPGLIQLGKALSMYANDDETGRLPDALPQLAEQGYLSEEDLAWCLVNVEYLGKGKSAATPPDAVLAYDKTMLKKGEGTNVLFVDTHVAFAGPEQLEKLGIVITDNAEAGVRRHLTSAAVRKQLEQVGDLSRWRPEMAFGDALEELKKSVEPPLSIVVLWRDLEENAGIDRTAPINMEGVSGIYLETALRLLLRSVSAGAEIDFVIKDGVIVIATKDALPNTLETRVYDIYGLAARLVGVGAG